MERRDFLTGIGAVSVAGMSGLAGCSSGSAVGDTVEAEIAGKTLWAEYVHENHPDGFSTVEILHVTPERAWLSERIEQALDIDNNDVNPDTQITDLPMDEIAAEIGMIQPFIEVPVSLQERDPVNDLEPPEEEGNYHWYLGPSEFFDRLQIGSVATLQVATLEDYYSISGHGRITDVLN